MTDSSNIDYLNIIAEIFKIDRLLMITIGIGLIYIISKSIRSLSLKLSKRIPNRKNQILQGSTLINFFVSLGGSFFIIFLIQPPREVIIAVLGSISVAIGLSLKDLVSSLISGITIITDPPFKVGDRVIYKQINGDVIHIGLRAVRILNADQQIITIPNSILTSDFVTAQNPGVNYMQMVIPFYMDLSVDIEQVKNILYEVACTAPHIYLSEKVLITVEQTLNQNLPYLKFNVKARVTQTKYSDDFQLELYSRALKVFEEKGLNGFCRTRFSEDQSFLNRDEIKK